MTTVAVMLVGAVGCGGESRRSQGGGAFAGAEPGTTAGAGRGDSAGESAGGAAGSAGASTSVDCSGPFGEPRVVFDAGAGMRLFSPTLSADETELLYAIGEQQGELHYARAKRASKLDAFGPGEPIPELDLACVPSDDRTIDLSADGLRAYLVCYDPGNADSKDLRIAARPTLDAPFALKAGTYGHVGASAAVANGELTLYTSGFLAGEEPALLFERATTSESFGDGQPIPGLGDAPLVTPDPSPDGLWLFGALGAGFNEGLTLATRANVDEPFAPLDSSLTSDPGGNWVSPAISEDCRSLYAVRRSPHYTVEVFAR